MALWTPDFLPTDKNQTAIILGDIQIFNNILNDIKQYPVINHFRKTQACALWLGEQATDACNSLYMGICKYEAIHQKLTNSCSGIIDKLDH